MEHRKKTLKQIVHDEVFKDIIQGMYKPGDIISEVLLTEKFGVSKAPVREALIELCNENVLRSIPRYGYEIIPITSTDVMNLREFRQLIECGCLRKHWNCFTPARLDELESIASFKPKSPNYDDITSLWENNNHFHLTLMSYYGNKYMYDELARTLNVLTRAFAQMYWDKWSGLIPDSTVNENIEHRELIRLIRENDIEGAVLCLDRDIIEIAKK